LLCRLYDVTEGEILIGGKNLKEWDIHSVRRQIGYVPQDTFLFSDTVENNISFGLNSVRVLNPDRVVEAAKDAGIYEEINRFPDKFKTMIGERGITLSGGQKQRIAIARAIIGASADLLAGRQVLIFDDCLSAVDTETEAEILGSLRKIMAGKTTILISHRVSTVKDASHIIALEQGRIKEEGTHQQLMDKKGYYFELYKMQLAEEVEKSVS
jgi:ATP-binding cassette subfamily B protein